MIKIQNTQKLQLFTKIIKTESTYESNSMPSWRPWSMRPRSLIKRVRKHKRFSGESLDLGRECFVGVNIQIQSKLLLDNTLKFNNRLSRPAMLYSVS